MAASACLRAVGLSRKDMGAWCVHQLGNTNDAEGEGNRPVTVANSLVHRVVATLERVGQRRCWVPVGGHVLWRRVAFVNALVLEEARDRCSLF